MCCHHWRPSTKSLEQEIVCILTENHGRVQYRLFWLEKLSGSRSRGITLSSDGLVFKILLQPVLLIFIVIFLPLTDQRQILIIIGIPRTVYFDYTWRTALRQWPRCKFVAFLKIVVENGCAEVGNIKLIYVFNNCSPILARCDILRYLRW